MSLAPIILFTYNRPNHTQLTIRSLQNNRLCCKSELYLFSDGYKDDSDKEQVLEVRRLIRSIGGFAKKHIVENRHNAGLASNIINGVAHVVDRHGKAIVLEDDLITSPYFLTFMNETLEKFENEERIGHIHGFCYPIDGLPDAFLIKWTGSWGWATWKRAWQKFNPDGQALLDEIEKRNLSKQFDFDGNYPFTRMLRRQVNGQNDSWSIRWNASLFLNDILSINAGRSLVKNIGFDGSGRHSGKEEIYVVDLHLHELHPHIPEIEENYNVRKQFEKYYAKTNSFWAKATRRLNRLFKKSR